MLVAAWSATSRPCTTPGPACWSPTACASWAATITATTSLGSAAPPQPGRAQPGGGILYEISQDAVIRYNQVNRNRFQAKGWHWDGDITVASSFNVEVYGNRLSGTTTASPRPSRTGPAPLRPQHLLDHYQVHDNLICATGGGGHPTGVAAGNGADLAARDITFSRNTIQSATCQ
jgi:hypothetical protein